jgi:AcrR family transcriptional regulator
MVSQIGFAFRGTAASAALSPSHFASNLTRCYVRRLGPASPTPAQLVLRHSSLHVRNRAVSSPQSSVSPKRYRGSSADERRALRRRRLIEAAVMVYGERGYHNSSVKAVCDAAGLTERYFYESFANSEALLVASVQGATDLLLDEIRAAANERPIGAARVRAMLEAYYAALRQEPVAARVFLLEVQGVSRSADEVVKRLRVRFADMLEAAWGGKANATDSLLKTGVIGALIHIAMAWVLGDYARPFAEVVDAAFRVCTLLQAEEQEARP